MVLIISQAGVMAETWPNCQANDGSSADIAINEIKIAGPSSPTSPIVDKAYLWASVTVGPGIRDDFYFIGDLYKKDFGDTEWELVANDVYDCLLAYIGDPPVPHCSFDEGGTLWMRSVNEITYFPYGVQSAEMRLTLRWQTEPNLNSCSSTCSPGTTPCYPCYAGQACNRWPPGQRWNGVVTVTLANPSSLGDWVWHDLNADGIQDTGEPGIADVTVQLYYGGVLKGTATTDANGYYLFSNLRATTTTNKYVVKFIKPSGYVFSPKNVGTDDTKDSDADTSTGETDQITLPENTNELKWDAGMYRYAQIIITKDAVPDDPQDFEYTTNIAGYTTVTLDDDSDPTLPNTITIVNVVPGVYTVTEGSVASWLLDSITITEGTPADSTYSLNDRKAELHVSSYETVSVTFKNTRCQTVDAGDDQIVCGGVPIKLMGTAQYYSAVYWGIKQGIGSISYPYPDNKLQVIYTPPYSGESEAILVLTATGACDPRTDEATVYVVEQPEAIIRRV